MEPPVNSCPMSEYSETILRVRYAETDKMGVVYYGNYYIYFEVGRVEYMRQRGVDYKQMEIEDDTFIVVAESKCRHQRPRRAMTIRCGFALASSRPSGARYISDTRSFTTKPASCWQPAKPLTSFATARAQAAKNRFSKVPRIFRISNED